MENPLPPGWIAQFDGLSGKTYFVETTTGRTTWNDPRLNYQGLGENQERVNSMPMPLPDYSLPTNPQKTGVGMPTPNDYNLPIYETTQVLEKPHAQDGLMKIPSEPGYNPNPSNFKSNNPFAKITTDQNPGYSTSMQPSNTFIQQTPQSSSSNNPNSSKVTMSEKDTRNQGTAASYLDLFDNNGAQTSSLNSTENNRFLGLGGSSTPSGTAYGGPPNYSGYYTAPPPMTSTTTKPSKNNMTSMVGGGLGGFALGLATGGLLNRLGGQNHHHSGSFGNSGFYGPFGSPGFGNGHHGRYGRYGHHGHHGHHHGGGFF